MASVLERRGVGRRLRGRSIENSAPVLASLLGGVLRAEGGGGWLT